MSVQLNEMRSQPPLLDPAATTEKPHHHVWRGLALGLALAVFAWILLAAVGLTLYSLF
jgi:hypothetical protein